jgi:acyl carrier protein
MGDDQMSRAEVFNAVVSILKPYVRDPDALSSIDFDTDILEDLRVNSARLVDVIIALEDQFDIAIRDEDVERVATVGDAVQMISEAVN